MSPRSAAHPHQWPEILKVKKKTNPFPLPPDPAPCCRSRLRAASSAFLAFTPAEAPEQPRRPSPSSASHSLGLGSARVPAPTAVTGQAVRALARPRRFPGERALHSARASRLLARVVTDARVPHPWRSPPRWGPPAHSARPARDRRLPEGPCPAAHSQAPGTPQHVTADRRRASQSARRYDRGGGAAQGSTRRHAHLPCAWSAGSPDLSGLKRWALEP